MTIPVMNRCGLGMQKISNPSSGFELGTSFDVTGPGGSNLGFRSMAKRMRTI